MLEGYRLSRLSGSAEAPKIKAHLALVGELEPQVMMSVRTYSNGTYSIISSHREIVSGFTSRDAAKRCINDIMNEAFRVWLPTELDRQNAQRRAEVVEAALIAILSVESAFRKALPDDWESDPIHDACEAARKLLEDSAA